MAATRAMKRIMKDLEEFMLFTVLNNNELIINDNFFKIKETLIMYPKCSLFFIILIK